MPSRPFALAAIAAATLLGCVTPNSGAQGGGQPQQQQQKLENISYFDLGVCFPRDLDVPSPPNTDSLMGFQIAMRPQIMECLVNPLNRGKAAETTVTLKTTVTDSGVEHHVSGPNLTPDGQSCIQAAM